MKSFAERNPFIIGAVGIGITAVAIVTALNYDKLPFINQTTEYSAYFAEAGGLIPLSPVQVSGFKVGRVDSVELDGARVLVTFQVNDDIRLGDRTEAAIKTKSLLGAKILEVTPRGDGEQSGPIAIDRTRSPYQLPDALGDLTTAISGLDTHQVSDSLATPCHYLRRHPAIATRRSGGGCQVLRHPRQARLGAAEPAVERQ